MVRFLLHSYGRFDARHRIGPAVWPHFDILYVHSGAITVRWGRESATVRRDEGLLIFCHTPFEGEALTATARASVQHFTLEGCTDPILSKLEGRTRGALHFRAADHPGLSRDIVRAIALAAEAPGPYTDALRTAQLQLILGVILPGLKSGARRARSLPEPLREVLDWAAAHVDDLSIASLAVRAGYSPSHFRALFEKHLALSPGQYFRQLKLNEAKRLLRETRLPVKQIAAQLGFSDAVAFHRSFASYTKRTPGWYRRLHTPQG